MGNEKVSIIVPVYKVEEYLESCVNSIIAQTYSNIEIILVDDGSPDKCPEICEALKKKDKRIKVIHKQNGGLSDARNFGVKAACGEYVLYVDSDDVIEADMVEHLVKLIHDNNADIAVSTFRLADGDDERKLRLSGNVYSGDAIDILVMIYQYGLWHTWAKLIKADIAKNNLFKKGLIYEDYDNTLRLFLDAKKAVISMDGRYIYTVRSNSIMGERKKVYSMDFIDITEHAWMLFNDTLTIEKENRMRMQKYLIANLVNRYNTIVRESLEKYNVAFLKSSRRLIKKYLGEWIVNSYIGAFRKTAYVLLIYIPVLYEFLITKISRKEDS